MKKLHYHFIGIGGISMSALAKLLYENGNIITGSDIDPKIKLEFCDTNFVKGYDQIKNADFVIVNSAIPADDAELQIARNLFKPVLTRADLLGKISQDYNTTIAISGMHGKTSTTEMIAECFIKAGLKPTVHIGGISNEFNSNLLIGDKKFFITEACEYKDSFLSLSPDISIILNVEPEHLDYFENIGNIKKSFKQFAKQSKKIFANKALNIPNSSTFGLTGNFSYANAKKSKEGKQFFDVWKNGRFYGSFQINSIVQKNIENALACISVCDYVGIPKDTIFYALKDYKGVKRRMEILNKEPLIIHDYAHHPTEIQTTMDSIKQFYDKDLIVAFQPHTYSRTLNFFDDFTKVLSKADELFLLETYSAREKKIFGASAKDLYNAIYETNQNIQYYEKFEDAKIAIKKKLNKNSILLILGAGDINNIWQEK